MATRQENANAVYRDYNVDGVPSSGVHDPVKADIRSYEAMVNRDIDALQATSGMTGLVFASLAAMNADLAHAESSLAMVMADPNPANNGLYRKVGASGAGSWVFQRALPPTQAALDSETSQRIAADAAETSARQDADAALQSEISGLMGVMTVDGSWNASTNTPTLVSGIGTKNHNRIVSVAGATALDGISSWAVGDWVLFNGTAWTKIPNQAIVTSVAGKAGAVSLVPADVPGVVSTLVSYVAGAARSVGNRVLYSTQAFDTEFEVLSAHASNANPLVDLAAGRLRAVSQERRLSAQYIYPAGWSGRVIPVYLRDDGTVTTPYDFDYAFRRAFQVNPTTAGVVGDKIYWVSKTGSDANGGTAPSDALLTLSAAFGKPDVMSVMIEGSDTFYTWSAPGGKSVNISAYGSKKARFFNSPGANLSAFSASAGYTNVFEATSNYGIERPVSAFVTDEYGVPVGYKECTSIADVANSGPLSFFVDNTSTPKKIHVYATTPPVNGTTIYVTLVGTSTNDVFKAANVNAGLVKYLENVIFLHCLTALSGDGGNLRCLNVAAIGGENTSIPAWAINGLDDVLLKGCIAAYSGSDGFNNQSNGNHTEIDCIAYASGNQGSSSQSSTVHAACDALRIRGRYENDAQQAITDVGTGKSLNIDVSVVGPTNVSCIATNATREMWCVDCHPAGAGAHYQNDSTASLHIDGKVRGLRTIGTNVAGITLVQ